MLRSRKRPGCLLYKKTLINETYNVAREEFLLKNELNTGLYPAIYLYAQNSRQVCS
jgi:hypothetical protein